MNEHLVVEIVIPWRYDLGWDEDYINENRIKCVKDSIAETGAIEATFKKAILGVGEEEYNIKLRG